jgi:hypothetical protein
VTLNAIDSKGASASCQGTATVVDQTPPVVGSFTVTPSVPWPTNHTLVPITPSLGATENWGGNPTRQLELVTMNGGGETNAIG